MHLVIDGYRGDKAKMLDVDRLRDFLMDCPATLGMTRISEPKVLEYNAPKARDSGMSGFVIIAESHISVHTFPHRDYVNIDIFSCRPFDHQRALADVMSLFELQESKTWLLDRGLEWLDEYQGEAQTTEQRTALTTGEPGEHRV